MIKLFFLYLMCGLYLMAGVAHFLKPGAYAKIVPAFLPAHLGLVYLSGICEILFALLLLHPVTRPLGAWMLIGLLIAVFPANIQMAVNFHRRGNPKLWLALLRLPLQVPLIWWAWMYTR